MNTPPAAGHHYTNSDGESIFTNSTALYSPDPLCVPLWRLPPRPAKSGKELVPQSLIEDPAAIELGQSAPTPEPLLEAHIDLLVFRTRWFWRVLARVVVRQGRIG